MEVEQAAWAAFDSFRSDDSLCLVFDKLAEYHCTACGGRKSFDVYDDLPVCTDCGKVDDSYVSDEPEWRSGLDESGVASDPSRIGAPVNTDHFSAAWGVGTIMTVAYKASSDMRRLARINHHLQMNHKDRSLFHAYTGLDQVCKSVLNLPDNVIYAIKIKYRKFNDGKLTRGAVRQGVKANCVAQACHEFNISRTTHEIAEAFGIPARDLSRTYDIFQEQIPDGDVNMTMPADLISRFFNDITTVPEMDRGRTKMKIISTCRRLEPSIALMGRTPKAVAAAVMYVMLTPLVTKPDICRICDVSCPTLNKLELIVKGELKEMQQL
jgi:transcription initiation factor TFIIIB Brf1 subunit/transcription initiation factor TFIIB